MCAMIHYHEITLEVWRYVLTVYNFPDFLSMKTPECKTKLISDIIQQNITKSPNINNT